MADSPRIEELKRRVQSDPASIAFAALAEEYRRGQRFEEAIETCTAGLIRHPSYLSAHVTLGRALIEVGRLEDARNELEYVLRLAPENLAAIRGLAEIHDRLGEGSHEPDHSPQDQAHEPAAPEMTVAEIHAASGFSQPAAEETEPALSYAPTLEPEPATAPVPFVPPWEADPLTSPVPPTWDEPVTPPVLPPFDPSTSSGSSRAESRDDSREVTARSGLPPWEVEPAPSYTPISMEETPAPEAPPMLARVSQFHQTPEDEPALVPFDPSTSSGSSQSRDDSAHGSVTGLEEFLKAILRARAGRDAVR